MTDDGTFAQPYDELRQLFGAYVNRDFVDDYGSVAAAVRGYRRDTSATHVADAVSQIDALLAEKRPESDLKAIIFELGCEYAFAAGESPVSFLTETRTILTAAS